LPDASRLVSFCVVGHLLPRRGRFIGIEAAFLEHFLVVVKDDGRALERNAPRLASRLAVLHERRIEALEPRLVVRRLDEIVERLDRILVDQRVHVGGQEDRRHRRLAAFRRRQRLGDGLLVAARIDGLELDPGVLLFEIRRESVDDLGDRAAHGDRIVERHLGRVPRLRLRGSKADGRREQRDEPTANASIQHDFLLQ
jgi:hypothetical protein